MSKDLTQQPGQPPYHYHPHFPSNTPVDYYYIERLKKKHYLYLRQETVERKQLNNPKFEHALGLMVTPLNSK